MPPADQSELLGVYLWLAPPCARPFHCSEILIEKHWRGVARRDVAERFWATVCKHRSKRVRKASEGAAQVLHHKAQRVTRTNKSLLGTTFQDVPPIITTPMYYLIHVQRGGMFYLACVTIEVGSRSPFAHVSHANRTPHIHVWPCLSPGVSTCGCGAAPPHCGCVRDVLYQGH